MQKIVEKIEVFTELIAHYMYNEKPSGSIKPQITWYEDFAIVMLIFECSILHLKSFKF